MAGATHDHSDFHRGERGIWRNYQPANSRFSCAASEGGHAPSRTSLGLAGLDGSGNRARPIQARDGAGCGPRRTQPNDRSRSERRTIPSPHGCGPERRDRDRNRRAPPGFAHPDFRPNEPGALTPGFLVNRTGLVTERDRDQCPRCKNAPNRCPNRPGRVVHAGRRAHRVSRGDHFARRRAFFAARA